MTMMKKMNSFLIYSHKAGLGLAWVIVMLLLYFGYGIHWVNERAIPALARTLDKIEKELINGRTVTTTSASEEESSA